MVVSSDVKLERLTRYLFNAPSWPRSLAIVVILGLLIDGASLRMHGRVQFLGTLAFTLPALVGFVFTKPVVNLFGKTMTWNRSALLALACTVFSVIITLSSLTVPIDALPQFFAVSLGVVFGLRLIVLVAVADYRISRMLLPALSQSVTGVATGYFLFSPPFLALAILVHIVFGAGFIGLIWLIDRPMYRAFHVKGLSFLNAFIAHLTDGSKGMEDFFREIGEEVYVPQVSLFFRRPGNRPLTVTVPNVHPGPMGEIGGGNLPGRLQEAFSGEVMVPHGAATHDFNLVSETEIEKIVKALRETEPDLRYTGGASRPARVSVGSVQVLYQRFGDTFLLVSTRSPEKTEDLDYSIGATIMAEGHRVSPHVAFIDAHNSMTGDLGSVQAASLVALEYIGAAKQAIDAYPGLALHPLRIGIAHLDLPYSKDEGFGSQGVQVFVAEADGHRTAYVLIDGNNLLAGAREVLRDRLLSLVDEAEVMTTDSHVVNTISGKNPVGLRVPAQELLPYLEKAVSLAITDLGPAEVAGSTACCRQVVVFGSNRTAQLASTVNAMIMYIAPLSAAMLAIAFLLSFVAYIVFL